MAFSMKVLEGMESRVLTNDDGGARILIKLGSQTFQEIALWLRIRCIPHGIGFRAVSPSRCELSSDEIAGSLSLTSDRREALLEVRPAVKRPSVPGSSRLSEKTCLELAALPVMFGRFVAQQTESSATGFLAGALTAWGLSAAFDKVGVPQPLATDHDVSTRRSETFPTDLDLARISREWKDLMARSARTTRPATHARPLGRRPRQPRRGGAS